MKNSTLKNIGIFTSALFVAASATYLYSPTLGSHAAESQQAEINLTVGAAIAIRTSADSVNLSANPGDFVHDSLNVDVATNSQYGYTLTIEDKDDDSSMKHTNASVSNVVSSEFEGAKTSSTMADNTWGFSLNATDYYHIPVAGNPAALKRTTSAVSGEYDRTAVDFGAKVGINLTAGTYSDVVKFTAYVNGVDNNPEDDVTVREPGVLVSDACKGKPYVSGGVLTDPRDGNTYTVKELKDGQCWMTQNLRIAGTTITSENSNLPTGVSYEIPESDISTFKYEGADEWNNSSVYVDTDNGGYYTFRVATADWGTTDQVSGDAPQDICPKGWSLPKGGANPNVNEFALLYSRLYSYDLSTLRNDGNFILSGRVSGNNHTIIETGVSGNFWTSTVYNPKMAYAFSYYSSSASPAIEYNKHYGFTVRCVAR
jgi:uncharacterized protein (TIGR02145 family)